MFKVGSKFTVKFAKMDLEHKTTLCTVMNHTDTGDYEWLGVAHLHENDRPNRITGKKVALTKALIHSFDKS